MLLFEGRIWQSEIKRAMLVEAHSFLLLIELFAQNKKISQTYVFIEMIIFIIIIIYHMGLLKEYNISQHNTRAKYISYSYYILFSDHWARPCSSAWYRCYSQKTNQCINVTNWVNCIWLVELNSVLHRHCAHAVPNPAVILPSLLTYNWLLPVFIM